MTDAFTKENDARFTVNGRNRLTVSGARSIDVPINFTGGPIRRFGLSHVGLRHVSLGEFDR